MNGIKFKVLFFVSLILLNLPANSENKVSTELVKIIDGDTIILRVDKNEFPARLIGIDCFETNVNNRAFKQAYLNNLSIDNVLLKGKNSKKYLKNLYKNTDKTYFEFKGLDIYKRVLAVVYFDDINVNDSMKTFGGCIVY